MSVESALGQALPGLAVSSSPVDRIAYARDLWPRHHLAVSEGRIAEFRPELVVWPSDTAEVAAVVRFCAREGIPLVPYGAGSGVCGGILPEPRAVVLDVKRLSRVRSLDKQAGTLSIEAGAMGIRLEEELNGEGYSLGHFPSSILCSTVGGWVAARSAGQCSGLYGKIEDMVASLECVVGEGEVVEFKRRISGPDMTPLLIGSEGVLGVVTSATLRMHPIPQTRAFCAFSFSSVEAGWEAMQRMFQQGLRPAVARLYDVFDSFIARLGSVRRGKHTKTGPKEHSGEGAGLGARVLRRVLRQPAVLNRLVDAAPSELLGGATLILVFEGQAGQGEADLERARQISLALHAKDLGEAPARHWFSHRYSVSYRQSPVFMAGAFSDTMEVAAPWSRLADLYRAVRVALGKNVFVMAHLSHAYPDGCSIYFTFAGSAPSPREMEALYDATWRNAMDAAITSGGTLSHHHGVGRSKAPRLGAELGAGVDVIHSLRRVFDPRGIMNPGNLLPRDPPERRPITPAPRTPVLDRASLLVHVSGSSSLSEVESSLSNAGLTLRIDSARVDLSSTTVNAWIAAGAPGAPDPWSDPADHLLAGFTAALRSGLEIEIRPSPRRAVGPDLFALFFGMGGRVGEIRSAHLRAHSRDSGHLARPFQANLDHNPPLAEVEATWIEKIAAAAALTD